MSPPSTLRLDANEDDHHLVRYALQLICSTDPGIGSDTILAWVSPAATPVVPAQVPEPHPSTTSGESRAWSATRFRTAMAAAVAALILGTIAALAARPAAEQTQHTGGTAGTTPEGGTTLPSPGTPAPDPPSSSDPSTLVVTMPKIGMVVSIGPTGRSRGLASGLNDPRDVAVLDDGSLLVAETGANQLTGLLGPYGRNRQPIVAINAPTAITAAPNDIVFVGTLEGDVLRVDLSDRAVTVIGRGFSLIEAVTFANGNVYVADSGTAEVVRVAVDGQAQVIATGMDGVSGVAVATDSTVMVSLRDDNRVVRISDDGTHADIAAVTGAGRLAVDPAGSRDPTGERVAVVNTTGVVRITGTTLGQSWQAPPSYTVGLAVAPNGLALPEDTAPDGETWSTLPAPPGGPIPVGQAQENPYPGWIPFGLRPDGRIIGWLSNDQNDSRLEPPIYAVPGGEVVGYAVDFIGFVEKAEYEAPGFDLEKKARLVMGDQRFEEEKRRRDRERSGAG